MGREVCMEINILGRTGPKSIPGKANSSMNAVKHGAHAKTRILPHECADEYKRVKRELIRSHKPRCFAEHNQIQEMVDALWSIERFRLRLLYKQEVIFRELTPRQLAEMIGAKEFFWGYAPEYLKEPNTKISSKEVKSLIPAWKEYLHLIKNSRGIQNFNMVFNQYLVLFQALDAHMKKNHGVTLIMSHGKAIELEFQQKPSLLLEFMDEYAAHIYYMINFDAFRPKIRVAMSTWFFLQRIGKKESDFHDEAILREVRRYQSLQDSYLKLQKSLDEHDRVMKLPHEAMEKNETK